MVSELREALNSVHGVPSPAEGDYVAWPTEARSRRAARTIARYARKPLAWLLGFITLVLATALGILLANWLTAR